MTINKAIL